MVGKKEFIYSVIVLFAIIMFLWLVMAISGEGVKIRSPAAQANFSNSSTMLLNVTFTNATDITIGGNINQTSINASFFFNETGIWRFLGNSSTCAITTPEIACWGTISLNITNISDGVYSINATLFNGTDSISIANMSNLTALIRIDKTPPIAFIQNFSSPLFAEGNYSGTNIVLNASIVDVTTTVHTVIFNITNITGEQHNLSYTGVRESGSNAFKNFFNTTAFPDGTYNISVNVNDTVNNRNNSARFTVRFDNTKPIVFNGNISSPAAGTNYTGSNLLLNVSIVDVTSSVGVVYFNVTNATGEQNATFTAVREGTANAFKTYLNTTAFADSNYTITVWANDTAGNLNNSARLIDVRFDNTKPIVFNGNISSPVIETNYTGANNLLLNVSIVDVTSSVGVVYFNVTNSTGIQNATFTAVREGTANAFKTYLNTTGFASGIYNVTVWANDTAGNLNNSALISNIRLDNTVPIVFTQNISSPLFAEGNYSGTNLKLNVSVVDALVEVQVVYFNITNATGEQNATFTATRESGARAYITYLNTTGFADSNYTITVWANDTVGNLNNSASFKVRFDNTKPIVFNGNISLPLSGTNHTGTKIFNVSLLDALTGIQVVYFNVTNGTGGQNATYTATREGTTTKYSVSVNTAEMKDGNYTVTAFVNDTAGNLNNSAATTSILFDNTAPAVSVSCSPATVTAGDTITCTCARSDATSGINSNSISFVANPSTSSTGTFTSQCTLSDLAGNSASASTTYRVESGGSGTSSGGGSSGGSGGSSTEGTVEWKTTYTVSDDALKDGTETRELRESQRLKVNVDVGSGGGGSSGKIEEHYVGVVNVEKTKATIEVSSTPQRFDLTVGESKKVDLDGMTFYDGKKYYDLNVMLKSIIGNKAEITIMPISESVPQSAPTPEPSPVQEVQPEEEVAPAPILEETRSSAAIWISVIIIALIIAGVVIWLVMKRNE